MKKLIIFSVILCVVSPTFGSRVFNVPDTVEGEPQSAVTVEYLNSKISGYFNEAGFVASMSDFSTNSTAWTSDTTEAYNAALQYGLQMDYLNSTLSFSGGSAVLTYSSGIPYCRMFVDVRHLAGKTINVMIEGETTGTATTWIQSWCRVSGDVSELNSITHGSVSSGADFATQFRYTLPPDATVFYCGVYNAVSSGQSLTVSRLDIKVADYWEDTPIINKERLRNTKAWIDDIDSGTTNDFNVVVIGDSWVAPNTRISGDVYELFTNKCSTVGEIGMVGLCTYFGGGGLLDSAWGTLTKTGAWENVFYAPTFDGSGIQSTNSNETFTLTTYGGLHDRFRVYYDGTVSNASFRWRSWYDTDGVGDGPWGVQTDWATNTLTGTGTGHTYFERAITLSYAKRIQIETLTGTNRFWGVWCKNNTGADGVTVHKGGKSGATMAHFGNAAIGAYSASHLYFLQNMDIDLIILILGTNDELGYISGASDPGDMYRAYVDYLDNVITAIGYNCDILIVTPAINPTREYKGSMLAYREAQYAIAKKYHCAYLNLIPAFGYDPDWYKDGTNLDYFSSDGVHPDTNGLLLIKDMIKEALGL